jgi:hypothetical protein
MSILKLFRQVGILAVLAAGSASALAREDAADAALSAPAPQVVMAQGVTTPQGGLGDNWLVMLMAAGLIAFAFIPRKSSSPPNPPQPPSSEPAAPPTEEPSAEGEAPAESAETVSEPAEPASEPAETPSESGETPSGTA